MVAGPGRPRPATHSQERLLSFRPPRPRPGTKPRSRGQSYAEAHVQMAPRVRHGAGNSLPLPTSQDGQWNPRADAHVTSSGKGASRMRFSERCGDGGPSTSTGWARVITRGLTREGGGGSGGAGATGQASRPAGSPGRWALAPGAPGRSQPALGLPGPRLPASGFPPPTRPPNTFAAPESRHTCVCGHRTRSDTSAQRPAAMKRGVGAGSAGRASRFETW